MARKPDSIETKTKKTVNKMLADYNAIQRQIDTLRRENTIRYNQCLALSKTIYYTEA